MIKNKSLLILVFLLFATAILKAQDTIQQIIPNRYNSIEQQQKPYVILISIDGFRWDLADKYQNEILPINLNIYDIDGMEGLYVPSSAFREMTRTMGQNIVQGQNLSSGSTDFFTNTISSVYQSTSKTIADLIRTNKTKIKYNSFVYLIDNKELEKRKKNIYKTNTQP